MNKKEQEIQRKLQELENNVLSESTELSVSQGRSDMMATGKKSIANSNSSGDPITRSDGAYFGGLGLIALGLVMVFQQIRVAPSILSMLGLGSAGFMVIFVPLMIGVGMMLYNSKNKWGWIVTAGSCLLMILAVLSSLTMNLASMSLLQLIVLFLPFALGGGLLIKGMGGPQGVIRSVKNNFPDKIE